MILKTRRGLKHSSLFYIVGFVISILLQVIFPWNVHQLSIAFFIQGLFFIISCFYFVATILDFQSTRRKYNNGLLLGHVIGITLWVLFLFGN